MKKSRQLVLALLICALLIPYICPSAYAWGRNWAAVFTVDVHDPPEGAYYLDLLVPINKDDDQYCAFNAKNGADYGIEPGSEIVALDLDGFQSYTFHIADAGSQILLQSQISFFQSEDFSVQDWSRYYNCCRTFRSARLAYLDRSGHVLAVTNPVPIYDVGMDQIKAETASFLVSGVVSGELFETKIWWEQATPAESFFANLLLLLIFAFSSPVGWIILVLIVVLTAYTIMRRRELKRYRKSSEKSL